MAIVKGPRSPSQRKLKIRKTRDLRMKILIPKVMKIAMDLVFRRTKTLKTITLRIKKRMELLIPLKTAKEQPAV
jgi:hypothetical protein